MMILLIIIIKVLILQSAELIALHINWKGLLDSMRYLPKLTSLHTITN